MPTVRGTGLEASLNQARCRLCQGWETQLGTADISPGDSLKWHSPSPSCLQAAVFGCVQSLGLVWEGCCTTPQSSTLLRAPWVSSADGLFVTDYFTRTPRKLSPFRSFASIELFHFHIPEDTVIAVWNLITFKEQGGTFGDQCPDRSITV